MADSRTLRERADAGADDTLYWSIRGEVLCDAHVAQIDAAARAADRWQSMPSDQQGRHGIFYQCQRCGDGSPVSHRHKE